MNEWDRNNLEFLLNASPDVLKDWYDKVDEDDREYASELLTMYGQELKFKSAMLEDNVPDITQAAKILQNLYKSK